MKAIIKRLFLIVFFLLGNTCLVSAQVIEIGIVGTGGNGKYILVSETEQKPVSVSVGQFVQWINRGTTRHTATAVSTDDQSAVIFDTGEISDGERSEEVEITKEMFEAAGGKTGEVATLEYFCDFHSQMKSSLVISERITPVKAMTMMDSRTQILSKRRNITSLLPDELNRYRDAWRKIQSPESGAFKRLAGFHGCPREYCHHGEDGPVFLAWHRQYVLEIEKELQRFDQSIALHYWDWTSSDSIQNGIPKAFLDNNYVSPIDNTTYPNPLKSYSFSCGGVTKQTGRNPLGPGNLRNIADLVRSAYGWSSYRGFNSVIDGPHGNLHTWVRGEMFNTTFAAYDPIFWAHHSNVDRQWASWQEGGGAPPLSGDRFWPLRGFTGRTISDVIDFRSLGYEYDEYDRISQFTPVGRLASSSPQEGNSRVFRTAVQDNEPKMVLSVTGNLEHPPASFTVHVFVDQPDAKLEDAKDDNPNFAGSFGIFGGATQGTDHASDITEQNVLQLSDKMKKRIAQLETNPEITLVATDKNGNAVPFETVPITGVAIRELAPVTQMAGKSDSSTEPDGARELELMNMLPMGAHRTASTGGKEYIGVSMNESYDEAYRDAANQAQRDTFPDALLKLEVVSVTGERGSIRGLTKLMVRLRVAGE